MRLFVGTLLSPAHQRVYQHVINELVRHHPGALRSIPENSAHFTHVFCADAPGQTLDAIGSAVTSVAGTHRRFEIRLGRPHVIPARSTPRLVCVDVTGGETQLRNLAADILVALRIACPDLSFAPSRSPHVTLARFRKQATRTDAHAVSRSLSVMDSSNAGGHAWIADVQVLYSTLTPGGPLYEIKNQASLATPL